MTDLMFCQAMRRCSTKASTNIKKPSKPADIHLILNTRKRTFTSSTTITARKRDGAGRDKSGGSTLRGIPEWPAMSELSFSVSSTEPSLEAMSSILCSTDTLSRSHTGVWGILGRRCPFTTSWCTPSTSQSRSESGISTRNGELTGPGKQSETEPDSSSKQTDWPPDRQQLLTDKVSPQPSKLPDKLLVMRQP